MDAYIKAIAYELPSKVVTNEDIVSDFPEWTIDKIETKIGVKERHVVSDGETALDIGVKAAINLFKENRFNKENIDFLIFCTESADYHLPPSSCIMQTRLGLSVKVGAIDVNLGCSGWIYSILLAKSLVQSGAMKNVLVVTSETYSIYIHPKDKGNRTIFGDGAAATLVSDAGFAKIGESVIGTDGNGAENLIVKTGGARNKTILNDDSEDDFGNIKSSDYIYMNGPAILNYTLEVFPDLVKEVLNKNKLNMDDIDLHVYHQPNKYMAKLERRKLRIPIEKYYECYMHTGNTVSSTIPIALYEAMKEGKIMKGNKVLSIAQGLGYSWGGLVLIY